MRHSSTLLAVTLLAAASVFLTPSMAVADTAAGPYLELGVGTNLPMEFRSSSSFTTSWDYNWGLSSHAAAGYAFGDQDWADYGGFRTELEISYERAQVHNYSNAFFLTGGGGFASITGGTLTQTTFLANGIYDFDQLEWPLTPHLGMGMGFSRVHQGSEPVSGGNLTLDGLRPSVQGIAGVEYPLPFKPNLKVGFDYRFIETFNVHALATVPAGKEQFHGNIGDQNLLVTLRYTFAAPKIAAIEPPPQPPATFPIIEPEPTAERKRAFQVFFDFNKAAITAEAGRTIQKAADAVKAGHYAVITVTGHTDTVGSDKYNVALSEARAANVKQQMVADGISAAEIATSGIGKGGLLVHTPDGVREPQNRRAEIVMK